MKNDIESTRANNGSAIKKTALSVLSEFDAESRQKKQDKAAVGDAWVRSEIAALRNVSLDTKSIFSFCFVCSGSDAFSCCYGAVMLFVALFVQTVVPGCIFGLFQPLEDVDVTPRYCPNRSDGMTKAIGAVMSLYFVVLTVSLCTNKLRGLAFLREFVYLGRMRSAIIDLGIFSQMVGMVVAGGAQYLLFIGNGSKSYLVLLLQSLAMQFCLTVDQKLVPDLIGKATASRIARLSTDDILCDVGCGGGEGHPVPPAIAAKVTKLAKGEAFILAMVTSVGLVWIAFLAYCI